MELTEKNNKLSHAPLVRLIFFFGLQSGLSLMAYSLFAIADTYFISLWVGDIAAGAVAATAPLTLVLSAISLMVGAGGGSVISRALSSGDKEKASKVAANIFILYWGVAIIVTVFGLIFIDELIIFFGAGGQLFDFAKEYAVIILIGAITGTGFSSLMRAEGCTKYALMIWIIPISLNVVLDIIFIYVLGWGVRGAAAATVTAQCVSVAMSIWFFFFRRNRAYKIKLNDFRPRISIIGEFITIGLPSLLTQLFLAVYIIILNRFMLNFGGESAVTAIGFAVKVQSFLILFQNGFVQGVQPVIAYNVNADPARAKNAFRISSVMCAASGIIVTVIGLCFGRQLLSIFTNTTEILDIGNKLLFWMMLPAVISFTSGLVTGGYQSVGKKYLAALVVAGAYLLIKIPVTVIMSASFGLNGICYSYAVCEVLIAALMLIIIKIKPIIGVKNEKRNKNYT